MNSNSGKRYRSEVGAVAIIMAVSLTMIMAFVAIVIDLGYARDSRRETQNAADAASLAGANRLYPTSRICTLTNTGTGTKSPPCLNDAATAAKSFAESFEGETWADCPAALTGYTVVSGFPTCISFTNDSVPKVRVVIPRSVRTGFGNLLGVGSVPVDSVARATLTESIDVTCGLCFLGDINTTKFTASVSPGGIAVNGSVTMSGTAQGSPYDWNAASIGYSGTVFDPSNKLTESVPPAKVAPFTDPWATKNGVPPTALGPFKGNINPCTGGPGRYGSYEFKDPCTFTQAGLYVFTGALEWKNVTVNATVGAGVTLYFTCGTAMTPTVCNNTAGGKIDTKNGDLILKSPSNGLGIIYDRTNTSPLQLQGNGSSQITGAIYAPASTWEYVGNSDVRVSGGPVILKTMTGNGTTGVKITDSLDATVAKLPGDLHLDQ